MEYSRNYYQHRRFVLRKRDEVLADKILDLTNLAVGALVFGQFIYSESFNAFEFFIGILILIAMYFNVWYYLSRFN